MSGVDPTWPAQRTRHQREQYELVRAALESAGWRQTRAARSLGCSTGTLRRVIDRYPELLRELESRDFSPGRPKSA